MHPVFSIISATYVLGIFILPGVVPNSLLPGVWNPYILLHIPVYGILMIFLVLTFKPRTLFRGKVSPTGSTFLPGGIALVFGILNEFHQSFIPNRDARLR